MKKNQILQIKKETIKIIESEAKRLKISVDELLLSFCGVEHLSKKTEKKKN